MYVIILYLIFTNIFAVKLKLFLINLISKEIKYENDIKAEYI